MVRTVAVPSSRRFLDVPVARHDVEVVAAVLLLLEASPESASRELSRRYSLTQAEAAEIVQRAEFARLPMRSP